jgi:hypothetical protein
MLDQKSIVVLLKLSFHQSCFSLSYNDKLNDLINVPNINDGQLMIILWDVFINAYY